MHCIILFLFVLLVVKRNNKVRYFIFYLLNASVSSLNDTMQLHNITEVKDFF